MKRDVNISHKSREREGETKFYKMVCKNSTYCEIMYKNNIVGGLEVVL